MSLDAFAAAGLSPALCRAIEVLGFQTLTPIQERSLPPILAGRDVLALGPTGSGKTLAFAAGLLTRVDISVQQVQGLVVCPTRELAEQVSAEVRKLARFMPNLRVLTLYGGVPKRAQVASLSPPPHIVVGTPGRLLDHLTRGSLTLAGLRVLVLDEADRMLDLGFADNIADLVKLTPRKRQTLLFSATFPSSLSTLAKSLMNDPLSLLAETIDNESEKEANAAPDPDANAAPKIEQLFFEVESSQRLDFVRALLLEYRPTSALVFCHTREDTRDVAASLSKQGFSVLALSGELEQREREEVLVRFSNGSCMVLVATDVAARGLDIKAIGAVIAWELPKDPDVHIHRIGRTGRAGKSGLALSLCTPRERDRAAAIAERQGLSLKWAVLERTGASKARPGVASMRTVVIEGGRADKLRPGDVLGALCGEIGLAGDDVGQITLTTTRTFVAIRRERSQDAVSGLRAGKIKRRTYRVSLLD
ncbi:MAG: ATP-dependent RNA helicase DbpA [Myxococcales bacterium]|nr:ATP-dependent RNA helicase DbpA [Myxococcales bacterium]